ncbi:BTAD domain-containing putative transcriptional regulator [Actinoplanes sp. NPDC051411]|uniref:BTAD domain-containing putative transcriptional regulator n=1 Tax=Actinoplanes sp. NPDC051411 TaxID=3155522 RepID=UPI00343DDD03
MRFEILGEVRALREADVIDLGPAKQRAVLAVLLLQPGRPVPTHQIVDAVWGDDPPENGANVVQKYVAGLRRVLDPDRAPRTPGELLALTGSGYVLRTDEASVDAEEFQAALALADTHRRAGRPAEAAHALRGALALWHGDALAGLTGPVFDAARTRLTEARANAWEKWFEIEVSLGHHTAVIPDLARLVEEFPLREGLRSQLMIALHQAGRQAEALAAFRDARAYFLEEFGAEPGERMQEAHRKILRGEPFYTEPVDPWAGSAEPIPTVTPSSSGPTGPPVQAAQMYAPPQPYMPFAAPTSPPAPVPSADPFLSMLASAQKAGGRFPLGELFFAILAPLVSFGFGTWFYFVYAGTKHHDRRQYFVAGFYAVLLLVGFTLAFVVDPSPVDSDVYTTAENVGFPLFLIPPLISAAHGALVAVHLGAGRGDWARRESARQLAAFDPARAQQIGIGRPGQLRSFSDGGLVDVNHASADDLTTLPGIGPELAYRIVQDRHQRGPFRTVDDLVARGVVNARQMGRIAPRLLCIAPEGVPHRFL